MTNVEDLSHCLEDYLEAIYVISLKKKVVRVKEVAEYLNVKTPSVVDAVSKLAERGFVTHEKYGYLTLTKKGNEIAKDVYSRHKQIFKFLNEVLGIEPDTSEKDACGLEHHISKKSMDKITKLIEFIKSSTEDYDKWLKNFNKFVNTKENKGNKINGNNL